MGVWQAVRGETVAGADEAFVARLLDQIDRWCHQHADDVALVGIPSLWRERVLDRLDAEPFDLVVGRSPGRRRTVRDCRAPGRREWDSGTALVSGGVVSNDVSNRSQP